MPRTNFSLYSSTCRHRNGQVFLERIGQSQNPQSLRVKHQKDFILVCWAKWEKAELSYEERIRDMEKNGMPIEEKSFRQFVSRMKLKQYSLE